MEDIDYSLYLHRAKSVQEFIKEAYEQGWMPLELA
jgi:hypothetical protein